MDAIDEALRQSLKIPIIFPWLKKPRCPSCGAKHQANPHWFRGLIMVFSRRTFIEQHFCPGKVNPTVNLTMVAGEHRHTQEIELPCFGLTDPHLHCQCNTCHYTFFMRTYEDRAKRGVGNA